MLLVTKENKLIINKLEMNEDSLKNLYDFVSDKRAIKDIKFINENAPKYRIDRAIARQKFDDIDLFAFIRYVRDSRYCREYLH